MPFVERKHWTPEQEDAALVILDPLLFVLFFWKSDLTVPTDRPDLPAVWKNRQIISKQQRMMCLDGADYMLLRDVVPEVIGQSSQRVALRTSRKIAKTVFLEGRIVQIPLTFTGEGQREGMVHAPGEPHLAPVRDRVVRHIDATPLFSLMLEKFDLTNGVQVWKTGCTTHWRVEGLQSSQQLAGRSMVGLRASYILGDEADFSGVEFHQQRQQTGLPTCYWYWGGVPRGFRGIFWQICQERSNSQWSVHRQYDMRANPLYHSQKAWDDQIDGNYYSQRVQTQVLGRDGEESVSSFPVVPVDPTIIYEQRIISRDDYDLHAFDLPAFLSLPTALLSHVDDFAIVLDYGYAPSPTELLVAYVSQNIWRVIARLEILRLDAFPTANLIHTLDAYVLPKRAAVIVIDAHGQGQGVLSALHNNHTWSEWAYLDRVMDAGFAGSTVLPGILMHRKCKTIVQNTGSRDGAWRCDKCQETVFDTNQLQEATLQTKIWLTGLLKEAMANGDRVLRLGAAWPEGRAVILGPDEPLVTELRNTTEVQRATTVAYISGSGQEHMTDALRCLMQAVQRYADVQKQGTFASLDEFGWAGDAVGGGWVAPWDR